MDYKQRFKELYKRDIIANGGTFSPLLQGIFDHLLKYEFNDNPDKMDAFINEIRESDVPKKPTIEERQTALEKSVLEIVETLGVPQSEKIKDLLNDVEI